MTLRPRTTRFMPTLSTLQQQTRQWLTTPIEPMNVDRAKQVRSHLAALVILVMVGQCLLPGAMFLSAAQAVGTPKASSLGAHTGSRVSVKPSMMKPPAWYVAQVARWKNVERQQKAWTRHWAVITQAGAQTTSQKAPQGRRLRVQSSQPGNIKPSRADGCKDCEITTKALDLSSVPTEKELRMAGQLGGALTPTEAADQDVASLLADQQLKKAGISKGLYALDAVISFSTKASGQSAMTVLSQTRSNPAQAASATGLTAAQVQLVAKANQKIENLPQMNWEFGAAMRSPAKSFRPMRWRATP